MILDVPSLHDFPDMRKKLGVTGFVISEAEVENYSFFLQAFVCVSIASPRVFNQTVAAKKKNCT